MFAFFVGVLTASAQTNAGPVLFFPKGNTPSDSSYDTMSRFEKEKRNVETVKEEVQVLREEAIEKLQDLKEKVKNEKDKVKAKVKEEILLGREQALERFDKAIERVENLKVKVEKQTVKMEARGIVIKDDLKNLSLQAESKLNEARAKMVEINDLLAKSTNQLSKEDKAKVVALTKEAQQLIKDAQKMLNEEIFELRKLLNSSTNSTDD